MKKKRSKLKPKAKSHKASNATNIETTDGLQYHLKVKPGDVADIVLLPGDPKRVKRIVSEWDTSKEIADYRQYVTFTGSYDGANLSAVSTGIGPPACEIAVAELKNVGVKYIIRVGSCGTLRKDVELGELIISEAAVRLEDTSKHWVMTEYPAFASRMVTSMLIRACEENNLPYHVGITASVSSFYVGQGREFHGYLPSHQNHLFSDLKNANVINFEMEASLMFVMGTILDMNMGAVCAVYANRATNEFRVAGEDRAIKAANEAAKILFDELQEHPNRKHWY